MGKAIRIHSRPYTASTQLLVGCIMPSPAAKCISVLNTKSMQINVCVRNTFMFKTTQKYVTSQVAYRFQKGRKMGQLELKKHWQVYMEVNMLKCE